MNCYYDYVLALIPVLLVGGTAALWVAGMSLNAAVVVGATGAIAIIGHALFVNVPSVSEPTASDTAQPPQQHASTEQ